MKIEKPVGLSNFRSAQSTQSSLRKIHQAAELSQSSPITLGPNNECSRLKYVEATIDTLEKSLPVSLFKLKNFLNLGLVSGNDKKREKEKKTIRQ